MAYLERVDEWLTEQLAAVQVGQPTGAVKDRIIKKIVRSYYNGQQACPHCNPRDVKREAPES